MIGLSLVSTLSFVLFVRSSSTCPHLCVCTKKTLICRNVILTPEYLKQLVIPVSIREVYFVDNKLITISADILHPFRHATKLDISRNHIVDIPPNTFQEFHNLSSLKLNHNKIRELNKDSFSGLENLENLELASNRITTLIVGMFDDFQSIVSIKLMNNRIRSIPDNVFTTLDSLRLLFIRDNKIRTLEGKAFQNMTMNRIDLSNNHIKRLPRSAFLNFKIKFKIMLFSNQLECACKDVMTYAEEFKDMQNDIWGSCNSPPDLKGKNILTAFMNTDCTLCDLDLCQNGGSCDGNQTSFSCMCLDQFKGEMCGESICQPEIKIVEKVVQLPSTTVLKYVDKKEEGTGTSSLLETKNNELETRLMILYAICSLELVIILCFVGLLIMGKYQDWRLMKKYNKQNSPHVLEKFRQIDGDNPAGKTKGYMSISELIPYSY